MLGVSPSEIVAPGLALTGAAAAFYAGLRAWKRSQDGISKDLEAEIVYFRAELQACRKESAVLRLRLSMVLGVLERNGITLPKELLE